MRWGAGLASRDELSMKKRKILLTAGIAAAVLVLAPVFGAFEAHVINVTAQIENGVLTVIDEINFGTAFPQEELDESFDVELSSSFLADPELDDVEYVLRQKPKCWNGNEENPIFGQVTENDNGTADDPSDDTFECADDGFEVLPLLCPYLSKEELTEDGDEVENDGPAIPAFHGPTDVWDVSTTLAFETFGRLIQSADDFADTWNVDLKVPCFEDECAQEWESFVLGVNPDADPDDYIQPAENEHALFGCDLWLEVTEISFIECDEQLDLMLVLDRSGSISGSELQTLKDAANAFVSALAPSADGVHAGQTSFATTGSLDLHLTDNETAAHAAIDALASGGFTNLKEGIELATSEFDDAHEHERPGVPDVMVVITDGAPNRPLPSDTADDVAADAADDARAAGIEIFVVGVGVSETTETYLETEIADDAAHYFPAEDFEDLEAALAELPVCLSD